MNFKFLTVLTLATVTFLSFSSIAKAEKAAQLDINPPESTAVIQDKTQTITEANSQSETVDNSTPTLAGVTDQEPRSSSGSYGHKCGEQ